MSRWTEKQVADAAPDAASLAAARRLAVPGPWRDTGCTDVLVWGKCQGSGRNPYQVSVDVAGPAYRCSCPSRKLPCKHALALLLLWASDRLDDSGEVAGFAADWARQRAERAASSADRRAAPSETSDPGEPVDPEARARRLEARLALMDRGVEDFRLWLRDLVRTGLAAARTQRYGFWDDAAARLVDSQLPGLAEQVRSAGSAVLVRADWAEYLAARLGRWWTVTCAWRRRRELGPEDWADLRVAVGWAQPSAEVRDSAALPGPWLVLGAHRTDDGRVQQQRTWLRGPDGELVQVLDFAGYGQTLAVPQLSGARLDVSLAHYPGHPPRRALFATDPHPADPVGAPADGLPGGASVADALAGAAAALAGTPWRDRHPAVLAEVRVVLDEPRLVDPAGHGLPLVQDAPVWQLLAVGGGAPMDVFGELEDGRFRPLTCATPEGGVIGVE